MRRLTCIIAMIGTSVLASALAQGGATDAVAIPAGTFDTILVLDEATVAIGAVALSRTPITNGQFLTFVHDQTRWRRSTVPSVFAERGYLRHWADDLDLGDDAAAAFDAPVTNVSWLPFRRSAPGYGLHGVSVAVLVSRGWVLG